MKKKPDPLRELKRQICAPIERAIEQAFNLTPARAAKLTGLRREELEGNLPHVLIKTWQAQKAGKTITKRRIGYPFSGVQAFNERRSLR